MSFNRSKWKKWVVVIVVFVVMGATIAYRALETARKQSFYASCNNHQRFIQLKLHEFGLHNNGALPYEAGVPGYIMLSRFSADRIGFFNCNHGSPKYRIGGWQAVNVQTETWIKVAEGWGISLAEKPIPFAWCGKPTRVGFRVVTAIHTYSPDTGMEVHHFNMEEKEIRESLRRLNELLESLGEPSVELNVPDGIKWMELGVDERIQSQPSTEGESPKPPPSSGK